VGDALPAAAVAADDQENLSMTKYLFFSGKGGVGKTTMAAATAVRMAESGKKTLILSTDPASNLADVFEQPIGHRIREILPNLHAMEIDPDAATEEYREHVIGPMRGVMPPDIMKVLEEQFRSACTVEIASFDRFTDFLGKTEFDAVIFDTAPTGHTIRLLDSLSTGPATSRKARKAPGRPASAPFPRSRGPRRSTTGRWRRCATRRERNLSWSAGRKRPLLRRRSARTTS
jgi:arsenite-transporting ATPase